MNLLLDTHCLIWLLTDGGAMDAKVRRSVAAAEAVWFSDVSIWELGLKWRKGKIALQPRQVVAQAVANGLRPLAITLDAVLVSSELRQEHGDPFHRLLYAQAKVAGWRLLSIDRSLQGFGATVLKP